MKAVNVLLKIYNHIPLGVINCAAPLFYLIPEKYRYGGVFWRQYSELIGGGREACEVNLLKNKIIKSYEEIPFYRENFDKVKFNPYEFKDVSDLKKIPMIDKECVHANIGRMIKRGMHKEKLDYVVTSGTTGRAAGFYQDKSILMREWAYVNYIWNRVGYEPDSSRLILRGKVFREKKLKGKSWQWDALKRELSIDIFAMTKENLRLYCDKIEKYKPEYIHGYMSAIMTLCNYIEQNGLQHSFSGVLAVSEPVTATQREYIEKVLKTRVFSFYGHTERLVMAAECEESTEYHIEPQYGFVELIDSEGNQIWKPGIRGEIVATGFLNDAMPLIRYRTGDIAEWSEKEQCPCGRAHRRLKSVEGRQKDVLLGKNDTRFSAASINMHSNVFAHVTKYQFYQDKKGEAILKIVPTDELGKKDIEEMAKQIYEKTGNELDVSISIVADIPLEENGKFKMINQKLDIE